MRATRSDGAVAPGLAAPKQSTSDTAHVASAGRVEANRKDNSANFRSAPHSAQALRAIEGEATARDYLARLQAGRADPDELAVIVSMLYGAALRGFCRVLAKVTGVQHG